MPISSAARWRPPHGGSITVVDSTFDGTQNKIVTNTGDVVVGDGQQLTLKGTIDNAGIVPS